MSDITPSYTEARQAADRAIAQLLQAEYARGRDHGARLTSDTTAASLIHHVRLVLDNDQGAYEAVRDLTRTAGSLPQLADALKYYVADLAGLHEDTDPFTLMGREILRTALAHVDYDLLAADYREEHAE